MSKFSGTAASRLRYFVVGNNFHSCSNHAFFEKRIQSNHCFYMFFNEEDITPAQYFYIWKHFFYSWELGAFPVRLHIILLIILNNANYERPSLGHLLERGAKGRRGTSNAACCQWFSSVRLKTAFHDNCERERLFCRRAVISGPFAVKVITASGSAVLCCSRKRVSSNC